MNCCQAMSWLVAEPSHPPLDPMPVFVPVPIRGCGSISHSAQCGMESTPFYPHVNPEEFHSSSPSKLASGAPFFLCHSWSLFRMFLRAAGHLGLCWKEAAPCPSGTHTQGSLLSISTPRSLRSFQLGADQCGSWRGASRPTSSVRPLLRAAVQTKGCLFVCLFVQPRAIRTC